MAGRLRQSQVTARDRPRTAASSMGDARGATRGADGSHRRPLIGSFELNALSERLITGFDYISSQDENETRMMAQLTKSPSVNTGMLIRRCPHDVFEALADPAITTRFWYTKSSGRMEQGAELTWEWEMYG